MNSEFPTAPGHAESWCDGMPERSRRAAAHTARRVQGRDVRRAGRRPREDAAKLFPDAFVHLGGDDRRYLLLGSAVDPRWLHVRETVRAADAYAYFVSKRRSSRSRAWQAADSVGRGLPAWSSARTRPQEPAMHAGSRDGVSDVVGAAVRLPRGTSAPAASDG